MATSSASHREYKPSSILKSMITPKGHKRFASDGTALYTTQPASRPCDSTGLTLGGPLLPPDHPDSQSKVFGPLHIDSTGALVSPRKSREAVRSPTKSLHKKTLSSVSLRSLGKDKKDTSKVTTQKELGNSRGGAGKAPKKPKSSTNLSGIFGKRQYIKEGKAAPASKDKENTTPPSSSRSAEPIDTPIWAQFSSQPLQEITTTTKIPLNDQRRSFEQEVALYASYDYSPSKQRNFFEYGEPKLTSQSPFKERPKSRILPSKPALSAMFENQTRKKSNERTPLGDTKGNEERTNSREVTKAIDGFKKQSRVMAAVAVLNGKAKIPDAESTPATSPAKLDPKVVDEEFEAVLESRNIPAHQRAQMRTLKLTVKADFVRTHRLDSLQTSRPTSVRSDSSTTKDDATSERAHSSLHGLKEKKASKEDNLSIAQTKRERPRSRTFTFSRADISKKHRGEATSSETPIIPKSPSTRSLISNASQRSVSKSITPDEFITYLKKTTKPQDVEVGKLHKLRLLLRNETVEWVNHFVDIGGMVHLNNLLHRILEVEWREDHEDSLLHELLRCLKGLCTTASALTQFADISSMLFPALIGLLFDEAHKGPSEFTTRELIIQIVFAHISTASETDMPARAAELMGYLKDPTKEKDASTIPFILQMQKPRPYQKWCKEITNVTKEVFWIFIHHLTVIPAPQPADDAPKSYAQEHFPGPRVIVPAAPYVGGVEWDATNYIATHLDLLNGLLASLTTREARNQFRSDLKVSGFEKVLGHLRTCNPKYYGAVHDALKVWIGAASEDGWDVRDVRMGPPDGKPAVGSPVKVSPKKQKEAPPQLEAPKMDLGSLGLGFDKEIRGAQRIVDDWI